MSDQIVNNKRIAKNTVILYGRMLLMMLISLYTSRVVLNALGVEDYGIYNVVGGVVNLFSIVSGSLTAAISRFITFELGKIENNRLKQVFGTSLYVQLMLIILIIILLETIGLWFLNSKMVIPPDRIAAANIVFQISITSFAIGLWSIPYNATIIAHEKMSAFAYISLLDVCSKLVIAFLILYNPIDRLVFYASLVLINGIIIRTVYVRYCNKHFEECRGKMIFDKSLLKEIFSFSGWNFIGSSAAVLREQGINVLLNIFFGPVINASRGIASSVNTSVQGFAANFMVAVNPQIVKSYSSGNYSYMFQLIFQGARFSFYILLILILPVFFTTPFLLHLWLGQVPEYAVSFTRLLLIFSLSECLGGPLVTAMLATGNIKNYQIVVGGCQLLNLPVCYIMLKIGYSPNTVFVVAIFFSVIAELLRVIMLRKMIGLSVRSFLRNVYFNTIMVTAISSVIPILFYIYLKPTGITGFIVMFFLTFFSSICSIFYMGCSNIERIVIMKFIKKTIDNVRKHK